MDVKKIKELTTKREAAKQKRNWSKADKITNELFYLKMNNDLTKIYNYVKDVM